MYLCTRQLTLWSRNINVRQSHIICMGLDKSAIYQFSAIQNSAHYMKLQAIKSTKVLMPRWYM